MMKKLKLAYHQFMERAYVHQLKGIMDESPTNRDLVRNSSQIEEMCGKLIHHTGRILRLSSEESEEHRASVEILDDASDLRVRAQMYAEAGKLGDELLGRVYGQ